MPIPVPASPAASPNPNPETNQKTPAESTPAATYKASQTRASAAKIKAALASPTPNPGTCISEEGCVIYNGYDFNAQATESFCNASSDDIFYETDAEGHCISFGLCYGARPAVAVFIDPPKPPVETARLIVRKTGAERMAERKHRVAGAASREHGGMYDPKVDDIFDMELAGYGQIKIIITEGVADELAQALLHKITDRMEEVPSTDWNRYALRRPESVREADKLRMVERALDRRRA